MAKQNISDRFNGPAMSLKQKARRLAAKATGENALSMIFDESMKDDSIRIQLKNTYAVSKRVAIFPGAFASTSAISAVAGISADVIAAEGDILVDTTDNTKKITVVCPNLAYIQAEFAANPQRISGIQLQVDNEAQLFEPIEVAEYNAVRNFGKDSIKPAAYLDPANSNKTLVLINDLKHFQLDRNHVMIVTLAAGRTLDISLTLGARFSAGQLLTDAACEIIGA